MQLRALKYLEDINLSCDYINEFSKGKNYLDYKKDYQLKFSIERLLITIGEAVNKLSKNCDIHLKSESAMVALRNIMVHEYESVHDNLIWQIINTQLIDLKIEVEQIIKDNEHNIER